MNGLTGARHLRFKLADRISPLQFASMEGRHTFESCFDSILL